MADFVRLTQAQKKQFNDIYVKYHESFELNESERLNAAISKEYDSLSMEPSGQYVLISKTEVHPQVWTALGRAGVGKIQDFDNGDEDPEYNKARKVDLNVLEALLRLLVSLIQSATNALTGGSGDDGDGDGQTPKSIKKHPQRSDDGYVR
ncbi:hypothetical protein [Pseudomonas sp. G5(2012)]|uniref:hypothetical protein n=1 Tax=unclassified Pseudomonas TaxID=196821 RepID=UPI0012DF40F1|nr:hypothetical protein [Pseudomonas sp. G5(2012)]